MNERKAYELDEGITQELTADGHFAGVEAEQEGQEPQEPFDPEQISIDGKIVPMETLIRRLLQGSIRLAPSFQRKEVWDLQRKSRLIESMMLNIPLPMFYVAADEKGNWDVVDGLQRLTTIKEFTLGNVYIEKRDPQMRGKGLRLQHLEFWGEKYNSLTFSELPEPLRNRILETEFRFTIINPGTPEEVKRNIFKRINTGGMPLTQQEIRHALYQGKSTKLLEELVETQAFLKATSHSVDDSRMAAREIVLRFLAFSIQNHDLYPKTSDMDIFLSDTMRIINLMPELSKLQLKKIFKKSDIPVLNFTDIETLKNRFNIAMERSYLIFVGHAFRKSYANFRRSPINKTLFEVWSNLLSDLSSDEFKHLADNKSSFQQEYHNLLDDYYFVNIISRDSWKYSGVLERYKKLKGLLDKYIK
jgi:hypothetical protein